MIARAVLGSGEGRPVVREALEPLRLSRRESAHALLDLHDWDASASPVLARVSALRPKRMRNLSGDADGL